MTELHEKSAGGIVYRKRNNTLEILLLAWKNARGDTEYVLPKGHIENDETAAETALREISEETGLNPEFLEVIKFMNTINYSFIAGHMEGSPMIHKEVSLFLVRYTGSDEPRPRREERFIGYKWFEPERLKDIFIKPDVFGFIEKNKHFM
ncbi:NUDIX domain-containing protein [Candidatus Gracilibacteria bacterium]|nr:NUDIX domain-containing protein [Candidatus Gracilibacteria bacterium]